MTVEWWRAVLQRFRTDGDTASEQLMATMLLELMNLPGAERIFDRFASEILEAQP